MLVIFNPGAFWASGAPLGKFTLANNLLTVLNSDDGSYVYTEYTGVGLYLDRVGQISTGGPWLAQKSMCVNFGTADPNDTFSGTNNVTYAGPIYHME